MIRLLAVAGVCLVAGCGSEPEEAYTSPDVETNLSVSDNAEPTSTPQSDHSDTGKQAAWNDLGKEAIKAKLRDPDSANFRNVTFYNGSGKPITCGEVNAKNGFGGYDGFERFIAAGDVLTVLESEMVEGGMDEVWDQFCR